MQDRSTRHRSRHCSRSDAGVRGRGAGPRGHRAGGAARSLPSAARSPFPPTAAPILPSAGFPRWPRSHRDPDESYPRGPAAHPQPPSPAQLLLQTPAHCGRLLIRITAQKHHNSHEIIFAFHYRTPPWDRHILPPTEDDDGLRKRSARCCPQTPAPAPVYVMSAACSAPPPRTPGLSPLFALCFLLAVTTRAWTVSSTTWPQSWWAACRRCCKTNVLNPNKMHMEPAPSGSALEGRTGPHCATGCTTPAVDTLCPEKRLMHTSPRAQ